MKQSTLNNIRNVVEYMDKIGWTDKVAQLTPLEAEIREYSNAIFKIFVNLATESLFVAEAKYYGYVDLIKNIENPELHESILNNHKQIICEREKERKVVEDSISELVFLLEDLRDRIITEVGNLPQTIPKDDKQEGLPKEECA